MTEQIKLILALQQIDNLVSLTKDNEYQKFLYGHLVSVQVELKRQLSHYE